MKYLLVLLVLAVALWLWRHNRRQDAAEAAAERRASARPPAGPTGVPQAMTRCATCGLHLPQADAIAGEGGWYCSPEHRAQAGR